MYLRKISAAIALLFIFATGSAFALSPVLECTRVNGPDDCTAVWGYNNPDNDFVPFEPIGSRNRFSPAPQDRGQPENFLAGRQVCVFTTDFNCNNLVWNLDGRTGTANGNANLCPGACLPCGPGGDDVVVESFSAEGGACDTNVPNTTFSEGAFSGCSINNLIATCLIESETEEEYDACVFGVTNELLAEGDITSIQRSEIDNCILMTTSRPIPTLSQWGLMAMAAVIGLAGLIFLRRRASAV